jgi:manganese oxidase
MFTHSTTLTCMYRCAFLFLLTLVALFGTANAQTIPIRTGTSIAPMGEEVSERAARQSPVVIASVSATEGKPSATAATPTPTKDDSDVGISSDPVGSAPPVVASPKSEPAKAEGSTAATPPPPPPDVCHDKRMIFAEVYALARPTIMLNRLGANIPDGLMFVLRQDVLESASPLGKPTLKANKRPRPLVLRANQDDCITITFTNKIVPPVYPNNPTDPSSPTAGPVPSTPKTSLHVQGMQLVNTINSDGSFVGANDNSLANNVAPGQSKTYVLYAQNEGTFLLYTEGDSSTTGQQLLQGMFGALNVEPKGAEWYRSQVTADDLKKATYNANSLPAGMTITPAGCASGTLPAQCTLKTVKGGTTTNTPVVVMSGGYLHTKDGQPLINYAAKYADGTPILNMLGAGNKIVHSDLTAIITGPNAGRFPGATGDPNTPDPPCNAENNPALNPPPGVTLNPLFCQNPAAPDRKQPYREVTVIYHEVDGAVQQAFPKLYDGTQNGTDGKPIPAITMKPGFDGFSINYGTGGIGSEIYANRIGVGPMKNCVDCKYEEFFLSAWGVGDPAMVVDNPANSGGTATKVFYPDDPSNVYHSYMNDHVKFRILHGGTGVPHVHHQHAHQWLQSPNSDEAAYLDSQMISPGASYTLEMVYNGSGNRNKTVGDSIFHCHFYPHFAAGMWAMWRVHDVFEEGTQLDSYGIPVANSRALPDGEILAGTPIPALVPMPTLPMAPVPAYVKIQKGTNINGATITTGGQIAIGGTCQSNKVDNIPLASGTCVNGQHYDGKTVNGQFVVTPTMENPGYPFFIPGVAGLRAPHPPLDFAVGTDGKQLDGGLPRHLIYSDGGTPPTQSETQYDWSKDLVAATAVQLDEHGQPAEVTAMHFFGVRCHPTFLPDGSIADCHPVSGQPFGFIVNGLPRGPQSGAPFADPAVNDDGTPVAGDPRVYKAAAIQLDVYFNKKGWHYPQQRMLALWGDVQDTLNGKRPPEPFFFRVNSGEFVEYWHTNLVPNYYVVDDFQVRTPTDILGQHIHLVKFDVTSSDGAGNGWNYEDGTFSPDEVREIIHAINNTAQGGLWKPLPGGPATLAPKAPPSELGSAPPGQNWLGAQTTVQRWWVDPLRDDNGTDRTMRTVFTHDHFGPSTHQQAGLYAGLVIEPTGSTWKDSETGTPLGNRVFPDGTTDGGPTSWKADIWTKDLNQSYREFLLEFQDFQLAYTTAAANPNPYPNPDPSIGYRNPSNAVQPPSTPQLISTGPSPGTQSVNYRNEPVPFRINVAPGVNGAGDLSYAFASAYTPPGATQPNGDPYTPMLRTYQNDNVQVRILVGAHMGPHFFNIHGNKWFFEPSWTNSGYRNTQAMGLSEHFEFLFTVPSTSTASSTRKCPDGMSQGDCADYLYSPSLDETGLANGMWGLMRAYDPSKPFGKLQPLPNNKNVTPLAANTNVTCPPGAPVRTFDVKAVASEQALPGGLLVFNSRGAGTGDPNSQIRTKDGIFYAFTSDLDSDGKLKPGVPVEPLIMRAAAGECIQVTVRNRIPLSSDIYTQTFKYQPPFGNSTIYPIRLSKKVGLHPQLLALDVTQSNGFNVGYNPYQVSDVEDASGKTYTWYAGDVKRITPANPCPPTSTQANGLCYTPIEFGSLNLMPSDPLTQHINGLYGGMIIEPAGSQWKCDGGAPCDPGQLSTGSPFTGPPPTTRASANVFGAGNTPLFREFAMMFNDVMLLSQNNTSAVNYRTEPTYFRYGNTDGGNPTFATNGDNFCAESNQLVDADPQTPIFAASLGSPVRFRMLHPPNAGNNQVFTLSGHVWQRNPYQNNSTIIGDNPLSQWMGSRDGYGSTDHADIVVAKAGGQFGVAGDYLYTSFLPSMTQFGLWGVFRVVPGNSDGVVITRVSASSPISVQGSTTVNPMTGLYASTVTIYKGTTPTGTPLGTATVNQFTGAWSFNCSGGACPTTVVAVTAKSQGGGVATFNPASQQKGCQPAPSEKPYKTDLQERFLRHPANTKVGP